MSLPSASPAPLTAASPRTRALMNGTAATICEDGLIAFPTDDGPEWFACHGCGGCNPATVRRIGPAVPPPADPFARIPAPSDDEPF